MARNRESTSTPADAQANTEQAGQTQGEAVTGTASTPVGTATAGAGATAAAAEAKTDNRHKLVTLNEDTAPKFGGPVGQAVKRAEYIRKRWRDDHVDRGSIKKEINSMGDNSTYQIIFAATKKIPGGPQKTATAGAEQVTAASQAVNAPAEQEATS
jgi:hypothetical protein